MSLSVRDSVLIYYLSVRVMDLYFALKVLHYVKEAKGRSFRLGRLGYWLWCRSTHSFCSWSKANVFVAKFLRNTQLRASPSPSCLCPKPVGTDRAGKQEKPTCNNRHKS